MSEEKISLESAAPLCKDCRWAELVEASPAAAMFWRCAHPESTYMPLRDYVTGRPQQRRQMNCLEARHFGGCRVQGRYWESP